MSAQVNRRCPFCAKVIPPDDKSRDHVFGEAFGGRLKVPSCGTCNSTLGHDVEGPLHASDSMLAFARAGAGLPGKPLRGQYRDDGTRVNVQWGEGGAVPRDPEVHVTKGEGTMDVQVGGTEAQVRQVWKGLQKKYGAAIPSIEEALADAARPTEPSPWVEMNFVNKLPNMHRFAAKVALSGGSAIWGQDFADTDLAAQLREIVVAPDGRFSPDQPMCQFDYLEVVTAAARKIAPVELPDVLVKTPGPDVPLTSQLAFGPLPGADSTAIFVNILNFPIPPQGIVLRGQAPGTPTLPVVLREDLGAEPVIWKLDDIFFKGIASIANQD